jgi:hypothetical protein
MKKKPLRFDEVLEKEMPDWYRKIRREQKRNVQRKVNIEGT